MVALPGCVLAKGSRQQAQAKPNPLACRLQRDIRIQLWGLVMRRIGTVVGLLAVLAAGGAHAADELIGDAGFETQMLGTGRGLAPTTPLAPWSSDNTIFGAQNNGQSYAVLVDGVEVGAFTTSVGQGFVPSAAPLGDQPPVTRGPAAVAGKPSAISPLFKPAAWALVILGFAAIGLTLRGGRRAEPASI
jgi:hypothetical protein